LVLPLEDLVNATQETYGKDYLEIIGIIKSGEYEKKFGETEREAAAVENNQADPTRFGWAGSAAKSLCSKRGRESTNGDLQLVNNT